MAGPVPLDRLPQEILLGVELDLAFQDDVHGLWTPFPVSSLLLRLH